MPSFTDKEGQRHQYATEAEVLEFANKIREAGGADLIEGLMPSIPEQPTACLIANALNFKCSVTPLDANLDVHGYDSDLWTMRLPARTSRKKAEEIASAVGCKVAIESGYLAYSWRVGRMVRRSPRYHIILPKEIGNTAYAFDAAVRGWVTKYRSER